jgi:hypothetical protein
MNGPEKGLYYRIRLEVVKKSELEIPVFEADKYKLQDFAEDAYRNRYSA